MKKIFFLILMCNVFASYGQTGVRCAILDALLMHEEATKIFYFDKHPETPIRFVDVERKFTNCSVNAYYGRKVEIVHDSSYLNQVNYSNLIIYFLKEKKNSYKVSVYYKLRNAIYEFTLRRKNKKLSITKFGGGYF